MKRYFMELKKNKPKLTKHQYRTIKGQLIAGDCEGAMKGLRKVVARNEAVQRVCGNQRQKVLDKIQKR